MFFNRFRIHWVIALVALVAACPVQAGPVSAVVTTHMLNVRFAPDDTSSATIVGVLNQGDRVEVLGRESGWLRVAFDGNEAFIRDLPEYVRVSEAPEKPDPFGMERVSLAVGEQKVLRVLGASRYSMGAQGIVKARFISGEEILLLGTREGMTDMIFWDGDRKVRTVKVMVRVPLEHIARDFRSMLSGVENLSISVVGDRIVLDGNLLTMRDINRVAEVAESFGKDQVLNLTYLDRGENNLSVARFIRDTAGLNTAQVEILGDTVFLSGTVYSETQRKNLVEVAKTQVSKVVDLLTVHEIMIDTDVMFVQVETSDSSSFGNNLFDGSGSGQSGTYKFTGKGTLGGFGTMDVTASWTLDLLHFLEIQVSEGNAKMIQRPHISTKSGEQGYFHSGGQFYFEVSGVQAAELKEVDYGLMLTVTPVFKTREEMLCTVKIEVSVPVAASGSEILNLEKFVTENTVLCKAGESIVISGIIQKIRNHFKAKTPILGSIPLLNLFFGEKNTNDSDKELIAVLTPRIMNLPEIKMEPASQAHSQELKLLEP